LVSRKAQEYSSTISAPTPTLIQVSGFLMSDGDSDCEIVDVRPSKWARMDVEGLGTGSAADIVLPDTVSFEEYVGADIAKEPVRAKKIHYDLMRHYLGVQYDNERDRLLTATDDIPYAVGSEISELEKEVEAWIKDKEGEMKETFQEMWVTYLSKLFAKVVPDGWTSMYFQKYCFDKTFDVTPPSFPRVKLPCSEPLAESPKPAANETPWEPRTASAGHSPEVNRQTLSPSPARLPEASLSFDDGDDDRNASLSLTYEDGNGEASQSLSRDTESQAW